MSISPPHREPSGKLQRRTVDAQNDYNRRMAELEQSIVLAQPHRRGEKSMLAESAIGRFVLRYEIDPVCYEAALEYARTRSMWASIVGAPKADRIDGTGGDVSEELAHKWRDDTAWWMRIMRDAGGETGVKGVNSLTVDNVDLPAGWPVVEVKRSLVALARDMGKM
jgi:hypothetical protein